MSAKFGQTAVLAEVRGSAWMPKVKVSPVRLVVQ